MWSHDQKGVIVRDDRLAALKIGGLCTHFKLGSILVILITITYTLICLSVALSLPIVTRGSITTC